ncbi:TetR/AcrR family transcriptional regulator [Nocardioides sp.]|uniref:TetR/AcrR family transcriptional regulator n=1 Tax=Nocardioides sp. TaxID=35761 RepID=UPI00286D1435|nr:TetR/AcrR family transcriptional regulator [Nocardioides sp.]
MVQPDQQDQPGRSYGGRSKAERAAERRERLVAATITLLGTLGEARTTMTAVCAEAGLTERYFYESFRGRDEALTAALGAVSTEIADAALAAVRASDGSPQDRVRAALGAVVDVLSTTPAKGRVLTRESSANAALRERRQALVGWFADVVATQSSSLFGDQAWSGARAGHHAMVFVAGYAELVGSWLDGDVALDRDQVVDLGADLLAAVVRRPT